MRKSECGFYLVEVFSADPENRINYTIMHCDTMRILLAEDNESDVLFIHRELAKAGINYDMEIVETRESFTEALRTFSPDIILSDLVMPRTSGFELFNIRQKERKSTPFIFVSGSLREEDVNSLMKVGLTDYVFKDRLFTLPHKLKRAVSDIREQSERSRTNESLVNMQAHIQAIFENSDTAYIMFDKAFNIIVFNPLASAFANRDLRMPLDKGRHIMDYFPRQKQEFLYTVLGKVMDGQKVQYESSYNQQDGTVNTYSIRFVPVVRDDGQVLGILMSLSDISARIEEEKQREFDRKNLYSLINNTSDLIWSVDRDMKLITGNRPFRQLVSHLAGKPIASGESVMLEDFGEETLAKHRAYYERAFAGEMFSVVDVMGDPMKIWAEISFYPISQDGKVIGTACYLRDITSMKQSQEQLETSNAELLSTKETLEQSEARLNQAQAVAHVGSWHLSFITGKSNWSAEAYRIYGMEPAERGFSVEEWLSFIHPDDLEYVQEMIRVAEINFQGSSFFHRIIRKDGAVRHVLSESRFELNAEGVPVGLYGVVHDITESRLNEMKLKKTLEVANDQNKRLQNFAYIISHNIRSHSANINGLISVIDEAESEREKQLSLGMLRTSAMQLEKTIENLNDIITIQNRSAEYAVLNLHNEVGKAIDVVNYLVLEANAHVVNQVDRKINIDVIPGYLDSILLNLVSNAIKYRSADRRLEVQISAEVTKDGVALYIRDNGLGIDLNKNGDKLFGMYKTFHNTPDARGFGLFITKNQVEAMKGRIEVESAPGKGSTFKVFLPNQLAN